MGRITDALRRAARDERARAPAPSAVPAPDSRADVTTRKTPAPLLLDLTRLTALVEMLDRTTAELRVALSTIEGAINDVNARVEVWVADRPLGRSVLEPEIRVEPGVFHVDELGYCAWGDRWGLAVRTVRCTDGSAEPASRTLVDRRPLKHCARAEQLAAADLLPYLVERMAEEVSGSIARIDRVKQTAASIVQIAGSRPATTHPTTWEIL